MLSYISVLFCLSWWWVLLHHPFPAPPTLTSSLWKTGEVRDLGFSGSFPFCLSIVAPPGCMAF